MRRQKPEKNDKMYYDWHDIKIQRRLKTKEELRKIIREKINSRINQTAVPVYSKEQTRILSVTKIISIINSKKSRNISQKITKH